MVTLDAPLSKVDSYMQESADTYMYYLACGHTKEVVLATGDSPDNVWMMRCEGCANKI
jgi:hypothetical protein